MTFSIWLLSPGKVFFSVMPIKIKRNTEGFEEKRGANDNCVLRVMSLFTPVLSIMS